MKKVKQDFSRFFDGWSGNGMHEPIMKVENWDSDDFTGMKVFFSVLRRQDLKRIMERAESMHIMYCLNAERDGYRDLIQVLLFISKSEL
jgi:hypothetical protein